MPNDLWLLTSGEEGLLLENEVRLDTAIAVLDLCAFDPRIQEARRLLNQTLRDIQNERRQVFRAARYNPKTNKRDLPLEHPSQARFYKTQ